MNTVKKTLLASCGIAIAMALYACGDDESDFLSDRDDVEAESSSSNSKGSGTKGSSSSVETIVDIKDGPISETDSIDLSEYGQDDAVVDRDGGKVYNLMTSGIDVWTLENLDSKAAHPTSGCYDYADSLCRDYGRLYLDDDDAAELCPDGFEIPRAVDYRLLLESKDDYKPVYAGSCEIEKNNMLACTGINDTAFYMTSDDSIVVVPKKGSWTVMRDDGRLGSVRCIKRQSITDKKKNLRDCSDGYYGRTVYVIESDSSFECKAGEWLLIAGYPCEDGETYLYRGRSDTLYVCSDNMWMVAGLKDIGRPCLNDNRHEVVLLSGMHYACSDSGWVALRYPATELGECYADLFGSVVKLDSNTTFICRNTGRWERATATDIYGLCMEELDGVIVKIDSTQYFCSVKRYESLIGFRFTWDSDYENANSASGFCTDERFGDTTLYNDNYYRCTSNNMWQPLDNTMVLPKCDSTRWDTTAYVGRKEYLCNRYAQKWQEVERELFNGQADSVSCSIEEFGNIYERGFRMYICKLNNKNLFAFQSVSEIEMKYGACGLDTTYVIDEDSIAYVCTNGKWDKRKLNEYEKMFGICPRDTTYQVPQDTAIYTCNMGYWMEYVLNEYERKLGICPRDTTYQISEDTVVYTCNDGDWSEYVTDD